MNIIGLTGPSGSGKSLICGFFEEKNIHCIDADSVYHSMLTPPSDCLDAIRDAFGDSIFTADGSLDRTALGKIVFNDKAKLELLNRTVLDKVLCKIRSILSEYEKSGADAVVVDAPTLIESGFNKECTAVISVIAPPQQRLSRIIERDCISEQAAKERISAQKGDDFYIEASDLVITNDGDTDTLKTEIFALIEKLCTNS